MQFHSQDQVTWHLYFWAGYSRDYTGQDRCRDENDLQSVITKPPTRLVFSLPCAVWAGRLTEMGNLLGSVEWEVFPVAVPRSTKNPIHRIDYVIHCTKHVPSERMHVI